jgi:hypothetical protein
MSSPKTFEILLTLSGSISTGIAVAACNTREQNHAGDIGWNVFWGCLGGGLAAELVPAYGIAFPIVATYLYFKKPSSPS